MGCGTSSRSKVEPPSKIPPNTLGAHYHVSYVLGRGEFATVRAGMQRVTGDLVAIKTLKRSETNFNMDAIREEIDCMKRIKHPGCIKLFETFKGTDAVHIVQERGEGGDLWMRIQETGPIPERTSLHVMRQLTDAVAFLHQNGVCHRDIKPANIIMMGKRPKDPAYWTAKITDFGFSKKDVTGYFKCMKTVHGTPEFVPPEILLKMLPERVAWVSGLEQPSMWVPGVYSAKCDVYSLGVMLYTMIAGNIPYSFEDNLPVLIQVCDFPQRSLPLLAFVCLHLIPPAHLSVSPIAPSHSRPLFVSVHCSLSASVPRRETVSESKATIAEHLEAEARLLWRSMGRSVRGGQGSDQNAHGGEGPANSRRTVPPMLDTALTSQRHHFINPAQRPNAKAAGMIPCIAEASLPGRGGKVSRWGVTDRMRGVRQAQHLGSKQLSVGCR
eukprot:2939661-Rhodomonas_salina.3